MMLVNFKKLVRIAGQAVLPGKTPAVTGAIGYRALLITLRWSKHIRLFLAQNGIGYREEGWKKIRICILYK